MITRIDSGENENPPMIIGDYEYILEVFTDLSGNEIQSLSHKELWMRNIKTLMEIISCFKTKKNQTSKTDKNNEDVAEVRV